MEGEQETFFPANTLFRSVAEKLPAPPSVMTSLNTFRLSISFAPNKVLPPGLVAVIRISSFLKSVCFSTTLIPLSSVRTVAPNSGSVFISLIFPGAGSSGISGSLETVSS